MASVKILHSPGKGLPRGRMNLMKRKVSERITAQISKLLTESRRNPARFLGYRWRYYYLQYLTII